MELLMKESISRKKVDSLIASTKLNLNPKTITALKNIRKKIDRNDQMLVTYNKRMDMGRLYADKSISLQNLEKKAKQTLIGDTHTDIDIENAHPICLEQYCAKYNISCPVLSEYNKNREGFLKQICDDCKCSRSVAKDMMLQQMYLGNNSDYCITWGIATAPPEFVDKFGEELATIAEYVKIKNEPIYAKVKLSRAAEHKNKVASTLSYVMQIIENDLLMCARTKISELGYNVETLCFDGFLIQKQKIEEGVLDLLSEACFEKTGYKVRFTEKPMTFRYDIDEETKKDFTDYEHPAEYLLTYNQEYAGSLKQDNPYDEYNLKKNYIEKFLCKVIQPEPQYVFQNGQDRKCEFWSPTQASNFLAPIKSGFTAVMGGEISFYSKYHSDLTQRIYTTYDFLPYNEIDVCPPNILNVFERFNPDIYGPPIAQTRRDFLLKPIFDLVLQLCGGIEKDAQYFHYWVAQIFQDPLNKPPVCVIIKGKQGTGKNMFLDAIGNMLNSTHYITSSNPEDFYGNHAEGYYRKLLVNLNEAEGKKTFDYEGQMKSYISENTMTINPKNVRPCTVMNCGRTCATTNKQTPLLIDTRSTDRRYIVYQTTDKYLNKKALFWSKLYKQMREPEVMQALYQTYMEYDLKDFNWIKERPLTQAYKEMCNLYSPVEALFFEDLYINCSWGDEDEESSTDPNEKVTVSISSLFVKYEAYAKKHRFIKEGGSASSSRSFTSKLVDLDYPITRTRNTKERGLTFVPKEMLQHSIDRNWLMGYEKEVKELCDDGKDEIEENYFIN